MKPTVIILTAGMLMTGISSLVAQNNRPQVDIKVNRELDENGNVVRYDSTYTWYYSSGDMPMNPSMLDSIMSKSFMMDDFFSDPFFSNPFSDENFMHIPPLSLQDFFENGLESDPFFNEFNNFHFRLLEEMNRQFDSLQQLPPTPPTNREEEPVEYHL